MKELTSKNRLLTRDRPLPLRSGGLTEDFVDCPIFLCGHRKTGTTMLLCLLDNHPELLVYPTDSGFFYAYYPLAEKKDYSHQKKIDTIIGFCIRNLRNEIDELRPKDRQDLDFRMEEFIGSFRTMATKSDKTPKEMLKSLMRAFQRNITKDPGQIRYWVEKTTSTEIYATEIIKWFPKAKFIHLVRDPRDNWASLKSGWQKRYQDFNDSPLRLLHSVLERGKLGMEFAIHNQEILGGEKYLVLRYEDLVNYPRKYLEEICEFLQINYSNKLLVPTVLGKWWKGNNFEGLTFKAPSNVNVGRWKDRITGEESHLIEYYFFNLMRHFGYETVSTLPQRVQAAMTHYQWHNFAQKYSFEFSRTSTSE